MTNPTTGPVTVEAAAAIVAHVLVSFGAGWGVQRERDKPGGQFEDEEIFGSTDDSSGFHHLLLKSTLRNFENIQFDNEEERRRICKAAFLHGLAARTKVGEGTLNLRQILETLDAVKAKLCARGRVCDF